MVTKLFNFEGQYNEILEEYVKLLEKSASSTSREERIETIEKMLDAYVEQVGRRPNSKILHRLANVILNEELTDRRSDKMTKEEYPIMSDHQYGRRTTGSQRFKNSAGVVNYEVPLEHAQSYAIDGIDYSPHTRSYSNPRP